MPVTVSTWDDFVSEINVTDNVVIVPAGMKWEVSANHINIRCAEIHGNGVEIVGLGAANVNPAISVINSANVEGVKFLNCVFSNQLIAISASAEKVEFRSCTFTGRNGNAYNTVPAIAMQNTDTVFSRCSFNIEGQKGYFAGNRQNILTALPYFRYCNITFKGTSFSSSKADSAAGGLIGTIKAFGSIIQGELGAKARLYQSENVLVTGFCTELQANYSRDILASKNAVQAIAETTKGDCSWLTTSQLGTVSELLDVYFPLFHKEGGI